MNKIQVVPSHTKCGRSLTQNSSAWSCHFCQIDCNGREVAHSFCATVRFSDASQNGNFDEWEALCHGQAAAEILQASPEDFTSWSEVNFTSVKAHFAVPSKEHYVMTGVCGTVGRAGFVPLLPGKQGVPGDVVH